MNAIPRVALQCHATQWHSVQVQRVCNMQVQMGMIQRLPLRGTRDKEREQRMTMRRRRRRRCCFAELPAQLGMDGNAVPVAEGGAGNRIEHIGGA
eukprot:1498486-Pyramimonas_sp.AAC.1